ncbi:hypothetical protein GLOTRDRAFT_124167 [Gloeophyllum trabeum ATCC 11539]|uniref:Uncharacterized protein n=1 Tax=Gloeophyllum trabeum (strain ATCC 11539 / FP-39264 / Madison 617) TaxID=670483 RepID=S7RZH3_GLOTA|nr:uncharacterized protein GLOTRDRAFT_124167 [Gloeophyllum trabeum ATCC 11539]EPQ60410.1 hypothetical protein GLOTRDRAFT_124167 [Gloeophyllum trabeum ATCC 11539]
MSEGPPMEYELVDFIKLSLSSSDNVWHSRRFEAVVVPNLCSDILLGGPFLSHNHLVLDHEDCTCMDKSCGYDLLNPRVHVTPPPPPPWDYKLLHNDVVAELKAQLLPHRAAVDARCEPLKEFNMVAAVRDRIEKLDAAKTLKALDIDYTSTATLTVSQMISHT